MNAKASEFGAAVVLVLHPEPLVGMMITELLIEAGAGKTLYVTTEAEADTALAAEGVDAAVLGINHRNSEILPIADKLNKAGIPFIVSGSLTALPCTHGLGDAPVVSALADAKELAEALSRVGVNIGQHERPLNAETRVS